MSSASCEYPSSAALRARIEAEQRSVEKKFYKSMKKVVLMADTVLVCEHSEHCVDGGVQIYSALSRPPQKPVHVDVLKKWKNIKRKEKEEKMACAKKLEKKLVETPTEPTEPAPSNKSLWANVHELMSDIRDTFNEEQHDNNIENILLKSENDESDRVQQVTAFFGDGKPENQTVIYPPSL